MDNDALREGQTIVSRRPGLASVSEGVITPQKKKKSGEAVKPCTLGKDDSVQSHESEEVETKNAQAT